MQMPRGRNADSDSVRAIPEERVVRAVLVNHDIHPDEVIDLSPIKQHWLALLVCAVVGAGAAWGVSYLFPNKYRAEILISLVDQPGAGGGGGSSLRSLAEGYSDLANMVGLGNTSETDRERGATIAMLKSHLFVQQFIADHHLLPDLFPRRWDAGAQRWRADGRPAPTLQDGGNMFIKQALSVNEDKKTGLVTLKITWLDRSKVADWANAMIAMANQVSRDKAIHEATESMNYLDKELEHADTVEIKQSIYGLVEAQMNKRMLASTRPEFSFKVIDPAQAQRLRDRVSPIRPLFAAMGALLAFLIGCGVYLATASKHTQ